MIRDPLLKAFEDLGRRSPEAALVLSPTRTVRVGEIEALSRGVTSRARKLGIGPGTMTALRAPNGPGFLALFLGLRRAGCTVLLLDSGTTRHEIDRASSRFGLSAVASCTATWPETLDDLTVERWTPSGARTTVPEHVAVVKLTSASSGEPRGIATPSEALLADDQNLTATMGIRPWDRLLATVPFSHSYGLSSLVVPALVRGTVLVVPDRVGPFSPLEASRAVEATVFPTVPAYLRGLLRVRDAPSELGTLRLVMSAGARLDPETAGRFRERFGRPAHVFYGSSECGGITYDCEGLAAERGTVGQPVAGVRIELARDHDTDPGGAGRVLVSSAAVADGYLPDPADRLGSGRYASDDLGRWTGPELELVGRLNSLIHVRGKKVNPAEIERVLIGHDAVDDVAVLGFRRNESSDEVVRAVIACRPGSLTEEQVARWCRDRLSDFKLPRSIVLVDRIPRNARGKVDRAALRDLRTTVALDGGSRG